MPAFFGGHPHPTLYVAQPKDNTLQSLLIEAFKLLELRFADYDVDGRSKKGELQSPNEGGRSMQSSRFLRGHQGRLSNTESR